MQLLRDADIDPAPLAGKKVAVIGFGNQGRAQSLNLKDSDVDVAVGLRTGSLNAAVAQALCLEVMGLEEAAVWADVHDADEIFAAARPFVKAVIDAGLLPGTKK